MSTPRVLFILKRRPSGPYGSWSYSETDAPLPSGLSVSAKQISNALDDVRIENKIVQVVDNNDIDREVTEYRPTHVIIEAFWVVPEKFDVLRRLHPTVKFIVRNHSKSDFLSHEGGMVGWAIDYIERGIVLACNSPEAVRDFRRLARSIGADPMNVVYLPNYYQAPKSIPHVKILLWKILRRIGINGQRPEFENETLDVGCFGAVRPLKNHLHQAMASIYAAEKMGLKLRFWINANRLEGKAEPILTSLRQLFKRYSRHQLIEMPWMEHDQFLLGVSRMDVVMQVSNSETFNIVAADAVAHGVPVVVSSEIPWLDTEYHANPNDVLDIAKKMIRVLKGSGNGYLQQDQLASLNAYSRRSKYLWNRFLRARPVKD